MENTSLNESQRSIKSPAVSVIVPAYNTEKYIAECLDSVLAQTFKDYEVICIDDGSTDKSLSIFEEYARRDSRIKVMHQKNQGVVAARNNAIATAHGEYIAPLDSDNIMMSDCLETLYNFITTHDYSVVSCSVRFFGELSKEKIYWDWPKPTKYNMYAYRNGLDNFAMYPKKFWEKYGGYDHLFDKGLEDYDFWLNFFDDGQKVIRLSDRLAYYRIKSIEESRNKQASKMRDELRANLRRKHPKMIKYIYVFKIIRPLQKLLRFFLRWGCTEHGFIIRICGITVYKGSTYCS
ncbi:MAG: glycosyltransferase family 2 protein [Holophagales bacterium]|jgi:glycosyltransferase involved in cell wall biosynthesis|nr:glycosyltransferase family 2 protein [Holophagales bacterium]